MHDDDHSKAFFKIVTKWGLQQETLKGLWGLDGKIFLQHNSILVVEVRVEGSYEGMKETMMMNDFGTAW